MPKWILELQDSWKNDHEASSVIEELLVDASSRPSYTFTNHLLRYDQRLYVGSSGSLRHTIWEELHSSPIGGHSGVNATIKRITTYFYWPGLTKDVKLWNAECLVCQANKSETIPSPGLLQPLPIPQHAWQDISMDFIEGLPLSMSKNVIFVVVDRFSKYAHFMALKHPFSASSVAQVFLDNVFKLHGRPLSIVSDRGALFLSNFWKTLFELVGTKLLHSTAYHPQTDGQTERVNQCLENYLRCMTSMQPRHWARWLSLAEWWYNSAYHSSLKHSPFEVLYGYPPSAHAFPQQPLTGHQEVDTFLQDRQNAFRIIKDNLLAAQNRMKVYADKKRSERQFQVGEWVYLRLQPYRQNTLALRRNLKLAPRYFGPYLILDKIGQMAYKLQLPADSTIHPVLHVSQLKKYISPKCIPSQTLPLMTLAGEPALTPHQIINSKLLPVNGELIPHLLVQWTAEQPLDATWETASTLATHFPEF
ncbi:hypothetical protein ACHQM5_002212 [Ranunculus cassubicifolius]